MKSGVLVVGDLLIDRTWLVGESSTKRLFTPHYAVTPRELVDANKKTDVIGGIGTIARTLTVNDDPKDPRPVYVAGVWNDVVEREMLQLVPPEGALAYAVSDDPTRLGHLHFRRLAPSPVSASMRLRVYAPQFKGARLLHRFDRDWAVPQNLELDLAQLPAAADVSFVIMGDYGNRLLEHARLRREIEQRYGGTSILLRSAAETLVREFPWTMLSLDLRRLAHLLEREPFELPVTKHIDDECRLHPALLDALEAFDTKFLTEAPNRILLLNLEREGLLLLHHRDVTPFIVATPADAPGPGVGAIDVQLAWFVRERLSRGAEADAVESSAREAVHAGFTFSSHALQLEQGDFFAAPIAISDTSNTPAIIEKKAKRLDELTAALRFARNIGEIVSHGSLPPNPRVRLHEANWYLHDFMTINKEFGEDITRLKRRLNEYLNDPNPKRPFVTALCGDPGAGKSTLAERLGAEIGCHVIRDNAAQWTTPEDLFPLCERIRSVHARGGRPPLAFIDEVDVEFPGQQHLYSKLLAPVWDGLYLLHGESRTLGLPVIFILAGSGEPWNSRDDLLAAGAMPQGPSKLADLVSRLTVQPIEVPALQNRREDIVYLVTYNLMNRFPRIRTADEGIFRLLTQSTCRYGSRSVSRVIELIAAPANETQISNDDLPQQRDPDLKMFLTNIPKDWRLQKTPILVSP